MHHSLLAIAIALAFSFASSSVFAQQQQLSTKSKRAIELFHKGENNLMYERYQQALIDFDNALREDRKFTEAYFMKAEIYHDLGNSELEFDCLQKGFGLDSTMFVTGYYNAGMALCHLGRFDEAVEWFELYKHFSEGKKRKYDPDKWLEKARVAKALLENPVPFNPQHISPLLVSDYDMYWPSITLDEQEICFTVLVPRDSLAFARNPQMAHTFRNFNEDFYLSRRVDGQWQRMEPVADINTPNNEGAQALSPDGRWMFFTACGRSDSKGSCDIYFSRRTGSGWSAPVNIGGPVNSPAWESQPCFSADGQTLYFVSNRGGGKGGNDIWAANIVGMRSNGVPLFGNVYNLGDSINTSSDEVSPFIHPDNRTLYFSSDGWPGVGKLDIFYSRRDSLGEWQRPVNLGYPINTAQDDNGLVVSASGRTAYYSSERNSQDGFSRRELLMFDLPEEARPEAVSYIKGLVFDQHTHAPLAAKIELLDLATGAKVVNALSDAQNGRFVVNLPAGHDYALIAQTSGYLLHSQNFSLAEVKTAADPVLLDIPLSPIAKGEKVALRNVFFAFNSTELSHESHIELDRMVQILNDNPTLRIEIGGHTDSDGTEAYNLRLSQGRAQATVDYLVSKGIARERLTSVGYGQSLPLASNDTEEGKALNRRIEAKIIE